MKEKTIMKYGEWHLILDPKDRLKGAWMTAEEIGRHLGYENPRISILNIYKKYCESFKNNVDQAVIRLITARGTQKTTIFSEKGVLKIIRYSNTKEADKIMDHVFDVFLEARNPAEDLILQRIKEAFFLPEPDKWEKRFPDSLARSVCRMYGILDFEPGDSYLRLANFYAHFIYRAAPADIYPMLLEKNPKDDSGLRRYKHHQFLTTEAKEWLRKQVGTVETLIRAAKYNLDMFKPLFKSVFPHACCEELICDAREKIDAIQLRFDY